MLGDPRTYTGAEALGLAFPLNATDIVMLSLFDGRALLGDLAAQSKPEDYRPTSEERQAGRARMSRIFD